MCNKFNIMCRMYESVFIKAIDNEFLFYVSEISLEWSSNVKYKLTTGEDMVLTVLLQP